MVSSSVVPSATRSRSICQRSSRLRGSSPVVGSSSTSTLGLATTHAARSIRRRMPPEYDFTSLPADSVSSSRSSSSSALARATLRGSWLRRPINSRLSRPLRYGSTVACCEATPILRRTSSACEATSKPATEAWPSVGIDSVVSMRIAVVLPAPLWPSRPSTVPGATSRSSPRSAQRSPNRFPSPVARIPACIAVDADAVITFVWRTSSSYIVRTVLAVHCTNGKR